MEQKINIAEILKDCPKGMELDCAMYDNCTYEGIEDNGYIDILINTPSGRIRLTKEGCYIRQDDNAKCIIFPKNKTTWEGFVPPCQFKDGDIIVGKNCACSYIAIFRKFIDETSFGHHACLTSFGKFKVNDFSDIANLRLATEEEKQKLFDVIKENGYKWNTETKILEKLPKFKVGDRVKHISAYTSGIVVKVEDKGYYIDYPKGEGVCFISFTLEKDYELAPNKFDITTLKPFDKVLVRDSCNETWECGIYSHYKRGDAYPYKCVHKGLYGKCIPYEGNEHLLDTANDCDEFYKTWK